MYNKNFSFSIILITHRVLNLLLQVQAQHSSSIELCYQQNFTHLLRYSFTPLWLYRSGIVLVLVLVFMLVLFNTTPSLRVRTGPGKPGKSWNCMAFSRTGKSWKNATGPGKFWKSVKLETKKYKVYGRQ